MAPPAPNPKNPTGRKRGRPKGSTNAARAARLAAEAAAAGAGNPIQPKKRQRYIPGGPGGGGRFVDADAPDAPPSSTRVRKVNRDISYALPSPAIPRRERSTRTRSSAAEDSEEWGSAAAMAASVKQAEDYKPREERSWEEFHPNLDIDKPFLIFAADEVDGIVADGPSTPSRQTPSTPAHGSMTPSQQPDPATATDISLLQTLQENTGTDSQPMTPSRRSRRATRDVVTFYGIKPLAPVSTPRAPKILPIQHQTPKEKLDLKLPAFRRTNRVENFEKKHSDQARYVDKAMSNVGYQESDNFDRPETTLIRSIDATFEEDQEASPSQNEEHSQLSKFGRVEYDMDEQDDQWLEQYNVQRKKDELEEITKEVFEITITKIEKEWHALEKRIPKPNPKPPQTHRPRSSSAAAVNGEQQVGDEPDSKCAICDDGDCENTNAIVFCDGCNLAVHQECYGVPFIPEGQWLCRKCQLCGRGIPTCVFCPNTDGAFKQTTSSKWAHLLCSMWIPEISLGNHTFMEPVMDVEKVPKTRWKLNCYICRQKMGACIQCSNKNCYQAFHVTCARRSRLYLKMKTSHGALAVLDGTMILKAFCDKHCPPDYTVENNVAQATRSSKKFYKRNMKGRIWAENHTVANMLAAQHRISLTETQEPLDDDAAAKEDEPPKNMWKLPSGAPIIPNAVFEVVESAIQRFPFRKRKDFLSEACRYWTLKREARRGAALLKRLQLQMESFTSMELTRRDFSSMGPSGKTRLARRIEFAKKLLEDLEQLKALSEQVVQREELQVDAAELEQDFVDECYFPIAQHLTNAIEKAISLDKELFEKDLQKVEQCVAARFYPTALPFAQALAAAIQSGISSPPDKVAIAAQLSESVEESPAKGTFADVRERRKLGKRILKAVQPFLESALRIEAEVSHKSYDALASDLDAIIEAAVDGSKAAEIASKTEEDDAVMTDAPAVDADDAMEITHDVEDTIVVASPRKGKTRRSTKGSGGDSSATPPDNEVFSTMNRSNQGIPPTPPQSNGSLGKDPADPLTEGGIIWYLKDFEPSGTSVFNSDAAIDGHHNGGKIAKDELSEMEEDALEEEQEEAEERDGGEHTKAASARSKKTKATSTNSRRTSMRKR